MDAGADEVGNANTPSLWKVNVIAFCVIFIVAFGTALWQTSYLSRVFLDEARDHAKLAAKIIQLNTKNTIEAQKINREIISSFLKSQIKFVRYLHLVEPFTSHELFTFAKEVGLFGITIVEDKGHLKIESTKNWLDEENVQKLCNDISRLRLFKKKKLYVLNSPFEKSNNVCVIAGINATKFLKIQESIGLENTLKEISSLSGVKYVKVIKKDNLNEKKCICGAFKDKKGNCTRFIETDQGPMVQVKFDLDGQHVLILAMDATALAEKQKNVWLLLLFFTGVLLVCGLVVSFWLYRQQMAYIEKIRDYERQLYQKRHEASLGRSAATIAHEIRNPLNSVSMGIQRLILDSEISEKNKNILNLLKKELLRTEKIISGLLNYARPSNLKKQKVELNKIIKNALISAQNRIKCDNVDIQMKISDNYFINADPDLLFQLFENIFINSFEALNNDDNELIIEIKEQGDKSLIIRVANSGNLPSKNELHKIFEPYFTTKTRGTGLGLAICEKIVKAHNGHIKASIKDNKFIVEITLPRE